MVKLRGQVKRAIRFGVQGVCAKDVLAANQKFTRPRSMNLNTKDRVQLAAIIRGNTKWAKEAIKNG